MPKDEFVESIRKPNVKLKHSAALIRKKIRETSGYEMANFNHAWVHQYIRKIKTKSINRIVNIANGSKSSHYPKWFPLYIESQYEYFFDNCWVDSVYYLRCRRRVLYSPTKCFNYVAKYLKANGFKVDVIHRDLESDTFSFSESEKKFKKRRVELIILGLLKK